MRRGILEFHSGDISFVWMEGPLKQGPGSLGAPLSNSWPTGLQFNARVQECGVVRACNAGDYGVPSSEYPGDRVLLGIEPGSSTCNTGILTNPVLSLQPHSGDVLNLAYMSV